MIRRLLTALLALSIATPMPALATGRCAMMQQGRAQAVERCSCCDSPDAVREPACRSAVASACNCAVRADTGSRATTPASSTFVTPDVTFVAAILPASVSTPQRAACPIHLATPPGAAAVFRPLLCSWQI